MPLLVATADSIGILGGYLASTMSLGFNGAIYLDNTMSALSASDVASGLIKAFAFGFFIALRGCYNGFTCRGGALGVGAVTTNAVVSASILILFSNYVLTNVFNHFGF